MLVSASPDMSQAVVYAPGDEGISFSVGSVIISGITTYNGGLPGMGVGGLGGAIPNDSVRYITLGSASGTTPLVIFGLLPYNPVSFSTDVINDTAVIIQWQAPEEINSDYFTVERSADGNKWEVADIVKAAGNSPSSKNYRVFDKNPSKGISYYRLKQTNTDGRYSYSAIRTVQLNKVKRNFLVVYPNPAGSQLTIQANVAELKTVKLYNMTGQDVTGLIKKIETNSTGMVMDVSKLPAGTYSIKTGVAVTKLLKQ